MASCLLKGGSKITVKPLYWAWYGVSCLWNIDIIFSTSSRTFFQRSRCHLVTEIWVHIAFLYLMRCTSWNLISSKINWHANCLPSLEAPANGCYYRFLKTYPMKLFHLSSWSQKTCYPREFSSLDYVKVSVATISSAQHFRFGNYFRHYYCCCRHQ